MGRSRTRSVLVAFLVLCCLAACGPSDSSPSATPPTTTPDGDPAVPAYESQSFQPTLTVQPPPWLPPEPDLDEDHFLTWVGTGADIDRAVRFLSPVGFYDPGHHPRRLSPLPRDYLGYLQGLTRYGAQVSAPTTLDVDGHPAAVVTASTSAGLDGSLGCPDADLGPKDCFGLQEFAVLHLAVVDVDGTILLAWARVVPGSPHTEEDFAGFEDLLQELRFR